MAWVLARAGGRRPQLPARSGAGRVARPLKHRTTGAKATCVACVVAAARAGGCCFHVARPFTGRAILPRTSCLERDIARDRHHHQRTTGHYLVYWSC